MIDFIGRACPHGLIDRGLPATITVTGGPDADIRFAGTETALAAATACDRSEATTDPITVTSFYRCGCSSTVGLRREINSPKGR